MDSQGVPLLLCPECSPDLGEDGSEAISWGLVQNRWEHSGELSEEELEEEESDSKEVVSIFWLINAFIYNAFLFVN